VALDVASTPGGSISAVSDAAEETGHEAQTLGEGITSKDIVAVVDTIIKTSNPAILIVSQ
jgi:hypothetical protein